MASLQAGGASLFPAIQMKVLMSDPPGQDQMSENGEQHVPMGTGPSPPQCRVSHPFPCERCLIPIPCSLIPAGRNPVNTSGINPFQLLKRNVLSASPRTLTHSVTPRLAPAGRAKWSGVSLQPSSAGTSLPVTAAPARFLQGPAGPSSSAPTQNQFAAQSAKRQPERL